MMADKLVGPKVKIVLSKFLPAIFMDAMRDSPDASVHMFEGKIVGRMLAPLCTCSKVRLSDECWHLCVRVRR